jgi:Kdo2-lipid IVA lauroyltransferase/acyltransferase
MIIQYYILRILTYPIRFLPYKTIHFLGKIIGFLMFFILKDFRKRALSNLALAKDLNLTNEQIKKYAIESFQNLTINILEYPKFTYEKDFSKVITCTNPTIAKKLYNQGQGIIFFCGHQANWEVLFLDGNIRMKGIAIGKPIKNKKLYQWIVRIREKNGGKIISPKNALKEGLRNLRKGVFLGIVGDQGMPDSSYSFPFLGRRAFTTTAPALLAYKTNSPIIVASTKRTHGRYEITYSLPIWPNLSNPIDIETKNLMDKSLFILQESIKKDPGQWLWQHNRWKQQTPKNIYKEFRKESICIILPTDKKDFLYIKEHLLTLKNIYYKDFIFLFVPDKYKDISLIDAEESHYFSSTKQLFIKDYRFKIVFNFSNNKKLNKHFLKFSAYNVLDIEKLKILSKMSKNNDLSTVLKKALCRPNITISENHAS